MSVNAQKAILYNAMECPLPLAVHSFLIIQNDREGGLFNDIEILNCTSALIFGIVCLISTIYTIDLSLYIP